jgi:hypothetical protein
MEAAQTFDQNKLDEAIRSKCRNCKNYSSFPGEGMVCNVACKFYGDLAYANPLSDNKEICNFEQKEEEEYDVPPSDDPRDSWNAP